MCSFSVISFRFCSIAYSEYSETSNNNSISGLLRMICLHNSDPIEPPAPVTMTTFPLIFLLNNSGIGATGSLPSKSMILTSFISAVLIFPSTRSVNPGNSIIRR